MAEIKAEPRVLRVRQEIRLEMIHMSKEDLLDHVRLTLETELQREIFTYLQEHGPHIVSVEALQELQAPVFHAKYEQSASLWPVKTITVTGATFTHSMCTTYRPQRLCNCHRFFIEWA